MPRPSLAPWSELVVSTGGGRPVQPQLLHTLFNRLLGKNLDFEKLSPLGPSDVANVLRSRAERDELI
jgi:hypothetical protein